MHTYTFRTLDESSLLQALENQGIVDQVMQTFDLSGVSEGGVANHHEGPVTTEGVVDEHGQHTGCLYRENAVCTATEGMSYKDGEKANESPQSSHRGEENVNFTREGGN